MALDVCEALVASGQLTEAQRNLCLEAQVRLADIGHRVELSDLVISYGFASQAAVDLALLELQGSESVRMVPVALPGSIMRRLGVVPIGLRGTELHVSALGSLDVSAEQELLREVTLSGLEARTVVHVPRDRAEVMRSIHSVQAVDRALLVQDLSNYARDTKNGNLLNRIIKNLLINALQMRASDIHITASPERLENWIQYRIDSVMEPMFLVEPEAMRVIVSRFKQDAGMDFSNSRTPQDGRFSFEMTRGHADVRVSSMPADASEVLAIRLLDPNSILPMAQLFVGHPEVVVRLSGMAKIITKDGGILLVTGPTGQGKSSTLATFMRAIDRAMHRVMTAEDPIENRIPLVKHTQINEEAGYTFAKALRALVRQDPDVLTVGEIRDMETAEIATRTAETGHLLLASLHTDNVADSVTRLIGMFSDSYRRVGTMALASLLRGVLNQRLVPRLCVCAKPVSFDASRLGRLGKSMAYAGQQVMERVGCERCKGKGTYGRVALLEAAFWPKEEELRREMARLLLSGQPATELLRLDSVYYLSRDESLWKLYTAGLVDAAIVQNVLGEVA
ncbi:GspE/PulE family protein [Paraburkholderia sp. EG287A]|uniref:GspE/PulE family protein n=1 Tax=Paraburkholderia sp. EG287A TaxID=3237012 RepID=UPI0034D3767D